jgi:ribonucleoside-diphosphate reductase alpha chain
MGSFAGYEKNAQPMLGVIRKHRKASYQLHDKGVSENLWDAQKLAWDEALAAGEQFGYRNSQVTVLAPTGTIGFMMDCDTTGIEPDIALIKYKKLVGGGLLKIVNNTVSPALKQLGYTQQEVEAIINFLDKNETIEGAPFLKNEHLPVFDCAFKPAKGSRTIHYLGHLRMMGATQPFLSGAISKTVNLPNEATIEDIEQAYLEAWKLGLKAVAVYRDGCKKSQPLNTKKDSAKSETAVVAEHVARRRLPDERKAITHKFSIAGHEGYLTVGMYDDGTPGELFITMAKEGSTVSGLMDSFACTTSLALQYGVPLKVLADKLSHMRFEPSGFTGNPDLPIAKSITDYLFRWLAKKFLPTEEGQAEAQELELKAATATPPPPPISRQAFLNQADAPPCHVCGTITVRNGACYKCHNCGATSGCS